MDISLLDWARIASLVMSIAALVQSLLTLRDQKKLLKRMENLEKEQIVLEIPEDYPVRPLKENDPATNRATCGNCGLSWDDAIITSMTPAPSARCPFEYFHEE